MALESLKQGPDHAALARDDVGFRADGLGGASGDRQVEGCWFIDRQHADPIAGIEEVLQANSRDGCSWSILLSYELGGWIEPRAMGTADDPSGFPLGVIMRLGDPLACPTPAGSEFRLGEIRSDAGRRGYMDRVARVREYIAAGDIYQANIAHQLSCAFSGDPSACARALIDGASPRYGATMRFVRQGLAHTICSISPELFIRVDRRTGLIQTEPMKGTRPSDVDAAELERSDKDRAELNMITDLMRNDIGRVCRLGSVRVRSSRRIEPHGSGVLQASSIVEGMLRDGVDIGQLIRAVFPPGSVTGAPKVRAMQIIDELEQVPRRSYCGSLMYIDAEGNIEASVAIRTAHIWGVFDPKRPRLLSDARLSYPVGAGIVADSDPGAEWAETLVKAAVLERILGVDLTRLG